MIILFCEIRLKIVIYVVGGAEKSSTSCTLFCLFYYEMVFSSRQPVDILLYNSTMRWLWNKLSFHICLDYWKENNMKMSKFSSYGIAPRLTWCLLTMSVSLEASFGSTLSWMQTVGKNMHLFWTRVREICMNISTLRSMRDGEWKSNLLLTAKLEVKIILVDIIFMV